MRKAAGFALSVMLLLTVAARAKKAPDQYCEVSFLVVSEETGKPLRNAALIMHKVKHNGKEAGGYELKTDAEGKTSFSGIPYGKLRVQVIMQGFQTFGDDFTIDQPNQQITIKLKKPQKQYSIYEDNKK